MSEARLKRFHDSYARCGLAAAWLAVVLAAPTGCKVQVDKSGDGGSENVKIATPFGSIAVNKDQSSSFEIGLPAYPGSVPDTAGDGNKSAKIDMGFGSWKLRVKMAHYTTPDNRDQVLAFYRKALAEYGGVIECAAGRPVGVPVSTGEGLTCDDSDHDRSNHDHQGNDHSQPYSNFGSNDLELKAGSPRHQHIVVLKGGDSSATHFSLIAFDLPHGMNSQQEGTN
jgi:hypothetical protein